LCSALSALKKKQKTTTTKQSGGYRNASTLIGSYCGTGGTNYHDSDAIPFQTVRMNFVFLIDYYIA